MDQEIQSSALKAILTGLIAIAPQGSDVAIKRAFEAYRQSWWPSLKSLADKAEAAEEALEAHSKRQVRVVGNMDEIEEMEDRVRGLIPDEEYSDDEW